MRLSRRGLILGGGAMLAGCATSAPPAPTTIAQLPPAPTPTYTRAVQITPPPLDPQRLVRPELMSRAMAALDIHHERIPLRDRMYLVDFQKFSGASVGAYATAGPSWGSQQGPNVLLDGLEYSNNLARDRAIIIHGADYADPEFLAREGRLGRSYGCFSTAHADLPMLRERMGYGRLLFAAA